MNWYDWFIRIENIAIYRCATLCCRSTFDTNASKTFSAVPTSVAFVSCMCVCVSMPLCECVCSLFSESSLSPEWSVKIHVPFEWLKMAFKAMATVSSFTQRRAQKFISSTPTTTAQNMTYCNILIRIVQVMPEAFERKNKNMRHKVRTREKKK